MRVVAAAAMEQEQMTTSKLYRRFRSRAALRLRPIVRAEQALTAYVGLGRRGQRQRTLQDLLWRGYRGQKWRVQALMALRRCTLDILHCLDDLSEETQEVRRQRQALQEMPEDAVTRWVDDAHRRLGLSAAANGYVHAADGATTTTATTTATASTTALLADLDRELQWRQDALLPFDEARRAMQAKLEKSERDIESLCYRMIDPLEEIRRACHRLLERYAYERVAEAIRQEEEKEKEEEKDETTVAGQKNHSDNGDDDHKGDEGVEWRVFHDRLRCVDSNAYQGLAQVSYSKTTQHEAARVFKAAARDFDPATVDLAVGHVSYRLDWAKSTRDSLQRVERALDERRRPDDEYHGGGQPLPTTRECLAWASEALRFRFTDLFSCRLDRKR